MHDDEVLLNDYFCTVAGHSTRVLYTSTQWCGVHCTMQCALGSN